MLACLFTVCPSQVSVNNNATQHDIKLSNRDSKIPTVQNGEIVTNQNFVKKSFI